MKIIKVDDINGKNPSVYEVIMMGRLVFASENKKDCEDFIDKRSFLYSNTIND